MTAMNRRDFLRATACGALAASAARGAPAGLPRLRVSDTASALVSEDGEPFFWLADTAWRLPSLAPDDLETYLARRAAQGFNVVQVHCCSLDLPDCAGDRPFVGGDPASPYEPFWVRLDGIVARAREHGLYIALVPMWGHEYGRAFGEDTTAARGFGEWVARRYVGESHVLWIVSGEYDAINGFRLPISDAQRAVLNAVAEGLRSVHGGRQLMTIHPGAARSSSLDFHAAEWLDFDMLQSGHCITCEDYGMEENHALIARDRGLLPTKPALDGEPIYEDTPDGVWIRQSLEGARADAAAMRRKAYWSVLAGACGHTYGHNDVYPFFEPASAPQGAGLPGQRGNWRDALNAPGAEQMRHVRALVESRPFLDRVADGVLTPDAPVGGREHVQAIRDRAGRWAMIYLPSGAPVRTALDALGCEAVRVRWYDPRTGQALDVGERPAEGEALLTPPTSGEGVDWVLVLDDASAELAPPGGRRGGA